METSKLVNMQPGIHTTISARCMKFKNKSLEFFLVNKNENNNAIVRKTVRIGRREANSSTVTFLWTIVVYKLEL